MRKHKYSDMVLAFIDHPWQEDAEITFTALIDEFRAEITAGEDFMICSYLKRLTDANNILDSQLVSDGFSNSLRNLIYK